VRRPAETTLTCCRTVRDSACECCANREGARGGTHPVRLTAHSRATAGRFQGGGAAQTAKTKAKSADHRHETALVMRQVAPRHALVQCNSLDSVNSLDASVIVRILVCITSISVRICDTGQCQYRWATCVMSTPATTPATPSSSSYVSCGMCTATPHQIPCHTRPLGLGG